jgi:hypothetical protein
MAAIILKIESNFWEASMLSLLWVSTCCLRSSISLLLAFSETNLELQEGVEAFYGHGAIKCMLFLFIYSCSSISATGRLA